MNYIAWGIFYLVLALSVFGFGYLFAAREFGKDIRFYKDCIKNQRTVLVAHDADRAKNLGSCELAEDAIASWIDRSVDEMDDKIARSSVATLDNAFLRGEKHGLWRVYLHIKGRI